MRPAEGPPGNRLHRLFAFPGYAARKAGSFVSKRTGRQRQASAELAAAEQVPGGQALSRPQPGPLAWLQQVLQPVAKREQRSAISCFPVSLCHSRGLGSGQACQDLMTVGTRMWGSWWDGRALLRVRIYDFAVYMDREQANKSRVRRKHTAEQASTGDPSFFRDLRQTDDIEMSLLVRAARPLPIKMLAGEYERILKRRMKNVGGDPADPALRAVVDAFRESNLPEELREGGSVRKGTVLLFSRDSQGRLAGKADGHPLVEVKSDKLCQAVFDLYFGDQPVSQKAKKALGESFFRLRQAGGYTPPQDKLICDRSAACAVAYA